MKPISFILLVFLLGFSACQNDTNKQHGKPNNHPQEILVEWQKLVDLGQFAQAKLLSTDSTKIWLDEIAQIEVDDDSIAVSQLQQIHCDISHDTADCTYYILEDGEKLYNSIQLVKKNGVWLVDIHDSSM